MALASACRNRRLLQSKSELQLAVAGCSGMDLQPTLNVKTLQVPKREALHLCVFVSESFNYAKLRHGFQPPNVTTCILSSLVSGVRLDIHPAGVEKRAWSMLLVQ